MWFHPLLNHGFWGVFVENPPYVDRLPNKTPGFPHKSVKIPDCVDKIPTFLRDITISDA